MVSSLHRWEKDPLYSAAEVVQDSAERMESIFRLMLHESSIAQSDTTDVALRNSINYHKRDLVTTIETTKWQLEDFERAVNLSAVKDKGETKEHFETRYMQFIRAIREQIINLERKLGDSSMVNQTLDSDWTSTSEQDSDKLESFLSGENKITYSVNSNDGVILRRFLDPNVPSRPQESNSGVPPVKSENATNLKGDGKHSVNAYDYCREIIPMDEGSCRLGRLSAEALSSVEENASTRYADERCWDLEASERKSKSFCKLSQTPGRINIFRLWNNILAACRSWISRNLVKKLKAGEDQNQSPYACYYDPDHLQMKTGSQSNGIFHGLFTNFSARAMNSCSGLRSHNAGHQSLQFSLQFYRHYVQLMLILTTICIFGIVVLRMSSQ